MGNSFPYSNLGEIYDSLCPSDDFISRYSAIARSYPAPNNKLLDLCCGTGDFAISLARRGYSVTGIDRSTSMLEAARSKKFANLINWINEDIRYYKFEAGFGSVTCNFDSLNYILELRELREIFAKIFELLEPDGFLLFDIITPELVLSTCSSYEHHTESTKLFFRAKVKPELPVRRVRISIVSKASGRLLAEEVHEQRGYDPASLEVILIETGFHILEMCDLDSTVGAIPSKDTKRCQFLCNRPTLIS